MLLLLGVQSNGFSQETSGSSGVSGVVVDSSGKHLSGITVEIENVENRSRQSTTSDDRGNYVFVNLPPGRYRIITRSASTPAAPTPEIVLASGRTNTINLTVSSSPGTEAITMVEEIPTSTDTSQVVTLHNTLNVQYLPWSNRTTMNGALYGAYNLSLLSEGIADSSLGFARGPVVSGVRPMNNMFSVDGIDNNDRTSPGPLVYVSNEATTTFQVRQMPWNSELGHTAGGQFNTIVRSGTNQAHGAFYNYFQNKEFNAMDARLSSFGFTENPRYDQNRLGGSLGGAVVPSKVFLFGNFEYIPMGFTSIGSPNAFAPTVAGLATLRSIPGLSTSNLGILQSAGTNIGAATQTTTVRGINIPLGLVNTTSSGWRNQFMGTGSMDWNISDKDQFRLRYVHNDIDTNNGGAALPAFVLPTDQKNIMAAGSYYRVFTPALTMELRFGYNRLDRTADPGSFSAFPNVGILGSNLTFGAQTLVPQSAIVNTYHAAPSFDLTLGKHSIRFGVDARRDIGRTLGYSNIRGNYVYSNLERFLLDQPPDVAAERGFGSNYSNNNWLWFGFLQDSWRIMPNLTVNLGARYSYATVPQSLRWQRNNAIASVPGLIEFNEPEADMNNIAPHVGFAWSPTFGRQTVIRGGFSMGYDTYSATNLSMYGIPTYPGAGFTSYGNLSGNGTGFLAGGGINAPTPIQGELTATQARARTGFFMKNIRNPYTMEWNAAVQQAAWKNATIEAKYLGTKGVHLPVFSQLNTPALSATNSLPLFYSAPTQAQLNALTTNLGNLNAGNPYAAAGFTGPINTINFDGNSIYHGGTFALRQRVAAGFQLMGSYTYSHLIDDSTGTPLDLTFGRQRATSIYDRRHRATAVAMFDVGSTFPNAQNWVKNILADMTINGMYTYQSRAMLPAFAGNAFGAAANGFANGVVINPNGGNPGTGSGTTALRNSAGQIVAYRVTDPNAQFIAGAPGVFGTGGRNPIIPLGLTNNVDVSVVKGFSYRDRFRFEVRGEAYNVFNIPQFTGTDINTIDYRSVANLTSFLNPSSIGFGQGRNFFSSNPRMLQLALRITF